VYARLRFPTYEGGVPMGKTELTFEGLCGEMGDRFAALGRLFGELGTPEAARGLLEA
jgi:hypothetical protein